MTGPRAVVEGVGETDYTRRSGRGIVALAMAAVLAACRDAGLDPRAIDGVLTYPYSVRAEDLVANLGLRELPYSATIAMGGASAVSALRHASRAVTGGEARHVVVVQARNASSGGRIGQRPSQVPGQHFRRQLEHPYGFNTPAQYYALICRRYMHRFGLTREQLGAVALSARRHANLNPRAQMHDRRLSLEDYLGGRLIADPFTLFDCSLETDGACAILVTTAERAAPRPRHAGFRAGAEARPQTPDDLTNRPDLLRIGLEAAAARTWEQAGAGPADMAAAMVYDCFTFEVLHQLEAAGFAKEGTAGEWVAGGAIDLGGPLPVNTHGGLLSEGHLAGLNHVIEAVRQLRGECGTRQVPGCDLVAVTGWGDLGDGSMAVLESVRRTS
jgi:acetyl-CoA acetyltransferase